MAGSSGGEVRDHGTEREKRPLQGEDDGEARLVEHEAFARLKDDVALVVVLRDPELAFEADDAQALLVDEGQGRARFELHGSQNANAGMRCKGLHGDLLIDAFFASMLAALRQVTRADGAHILALLQCDKRSFRKLCMIHMHA